MRYLLQCELTNACNCTCVFCPQARRGIQSIGQNNYNRPIGFMDAEMLSLFVSNARKMAYRVSLGFFGEQTIHTGFGSFARRLTSQFRTTINTNWLYVTLWHWPALKTFGCVKISMDASYAELYDKLRYGSLSASYDCGVQEGNRYPVLIEKVDRWLSEDHPPTWLVYTVSSINQHDVQPFLDQWLPKLSCRDGVIVKSVISYGGVSHDSTMQPYPCDAANNRRRRLTVTWDGRVTPCNLDVNCAIEVGNITETSLTEIVRSDRYKQAMELIRQRKAGPCLNCHDANSRRITKRYRGRK